MDDLCEGGPCLGEGRRADEQQQDPLLQEEDVVSSDGVEAVRWETR